MRKYSLMLSDLILLDSKSMGFLKTINNNISFLCARFVQMLMCLNIHYYDQKHRSVVPKLTGVTMSMQLPLLGIAILDFMKFHRIQDNNMQIS